MAKKAVKKKVVKKKAAKKKVVKIGPSKALMTPKRPTPPVKPRNKG